MNTVVLILSIVWVGYAPMGGTIVHNNSPMGMSRANGGASGWKELIVVKSKSEAEEVVFEYEHQKYYEVKSATLIMVDALNPGKMTVENVKRYKVADENKESA